MEFHFFFSFPKRQAGEKTKVIVWQVELIVRRMYFENECHRPGEWACLQGSPQKDVNTYICECVCVGEFIPGLSTVNPRAHFPPADPGLALQTSVLSCSSPADLPLCP